MKCKNCGAEWEGEEKICPECGTEMILDCEDKNPETEDEQSGARLDSLRRKVKGMKIALSVLASVLLLAVLTVMVLVGSGKGDILAGILSGSFPTEETEPVGTVPPDGNPDDETCKGSYSDTDENLIANNKTVVATMGDKTLTNGQLQAFYQMQISEFVNYWGNYISYSGLDVTKPLDQQVYDKETGVTWQQYFLKCAIGSWAQYMALSEQAEKEEYKLPSHYQKELDDLQKTLEDAAKSNGFDSVDEMIADRMGVGCTYEDYAGFMKIYYTGALFFEDKAQKLEISMDEIEAYFAKNEQTLLSEYKVSKTSGKLVDVRHILIQEGGTKAGSGITFTEEGYEICRKEAEKLLNEWLEGDKNETTFSEFAEEYSKDGSAEKGGLIENIYKGQMVAPFEEWCFNESRQYGDYGLVKSQYGYHIMFYVDGEEGWIRYSREGALKQKTQELLESIKENHVPEVSYEKINLWGLVIAK